MSITLALLFALAGQYAPDVRPETLATIGRTENNYNPLKIHISGGQSPSPAPSTKEEVTSLARTHITEGKFLNGWS